MKVNVDMYRNVGVEAIGQIKKNLPGLGDNEVVTRACMLTSIPHIVMWCLMLEMFGMTDEIKNKINNLKKFYAISNIISSRDYNF